MGKKGGRRKKVKWIQEPGGKPYRREGDDIIFKDGERIYDPVGEDEDKDEEEKANSELDFPVSKRATFSLGRMASAISLGRHSPRVIQISLDPKDYFVFKIIATSLRTSMGALGQEVFASYINHQLKDKDLAKLVSSLLREKKDERREKDG